LGAVVDRSQWPVVTVSIEEPADLDALADELETMIAGESPFALTVMAPEGVEALQEMLWAAPNARRRLRRQRAALAAWCEAAVHVMAPEVLARTTDSTLRYAELIWGCAALAARTPSEASDLLMIRLAERPVPLQTV
jgi:hypothetical protein